MTNENTVTNIVDLWVAAAMNVDNEKVFENDDAELEGPYESMFDGDDQNDNSPTGVEDTLTAEKGRHIIALRDKYVP